jgi:hypothetical protein
VIFGRCEPKGFHFTLAAAIMGRRGAMAMHRSKLRALVTGGLFAVAACGSDDGRESTSNASSLTGIGLDTGSGEGSGSASGSTGADDLDGADDLSDLPGADDGVTPDEGCRAVDFLFVIDNSVSMEGEQAALVEAFPGFIDTIQTTLPEGSDYHVMVVDTDEWGRCNTANPWEGIDPDSDTCNAYINQTVFEECDRTLGAGVVNPAGAFASNMICPLQGGHRYMDATEPDLADAFSCVAQVGTAGHSSERPMDALLAALEPGINAAGGCNEGYLRDDALLVVTFMSDDPNYEDALGPQEWYDAIVQAKLGDPAAIVMLGLTPAWEGCQDASAMPKGAHWAELMAMFGERGLHGNVCSTAQEYIDFFQMAVSTIDQACNEYVPPG